MTTESTVQPEILVKNNELANMFQTVKIKTRQIGV